MHSTHKQEVKMLENLGYLDYYRYQYLKYDLSVSCSVLCTGCKLRDGRCGLDIYLDLSSSPLRMSDSERGIDSLFNTEL